MNEIETAWVAGLLEGEGSFIIRTMDRMKRSMIGVKCGMTDEDVIRKLHGIVNFGGITVADRSSRPRHKTMYVWSSHRRDLVIPLLLAIRPHMGDRRGAKIDEIIQYHELNPLRVPEYVCGTYRCYKHGCRCDECKAANTDYMNNYRSIA